MEIYKKVKECQHSKPRKDIAGLKFGMLTSTEWLGFTIVGTQGKRRSVWKCICDCGNTKNVMHGDLTSGNIKTCGCLGIYDIDGNKLCPRCKILKPRLEFAGNSSSCKPCIKVVRPTYGNKEEKARRISEAYFTKHRSKRLAYAKLYKAKNKDKIKARMKIWRANNKNYKKDKWATDINFRLREVLRGRIYKAVKANSTYKSAKTIDLIGCEVEFLKTYLEGLFTLGMSWSNYGQWHIDHIKPCSLFDLTIEDEQRKCFNYTNLQPLWAEDNLEKSNKYDKIS